MGDYDDFSLYNDLANMNNLEILNAINREQLFGRRIYRVRDRRNPMVDFNEGEFFDRFRMTKDQVEQFYNSIDGPNRLETLVILFSKTFFRK